MALLLTLLAVLLYGLLGLFLAVVLLPFRIRAAGAVHDGVPDGTARVDWGPWVLALDLDVRRGGTLRVLGAPVARFGLDGRGEKKKERRRQEKARPGAKASANGEGRPGGLSRLRAGLAEREVFRGMAARIVRALHLRVRAAGRAGTGDPADTAALAGVLAVLGRLPGVELDVEPDWVGEALELELELSAWVWIAELLAVAAAIGLDGRSRRALRVAFGSGT